MAYENVLAWRQKYIEMWANGEIKLIKLQWSGSKQPSEGGGG